MSVGPDRIIELMGGSCFCEDCYSDAYTPADEGNSSRWVRKRLEDGTCDCCDASIVAGNFIDSRGESVVLSDQQDCLHSDKTTSDRSYP